MTRLQAACDAIVVIDYSNLSENFKSSAYVKYENCLYQFEETKAMLSDQLKLFNWIGFTPHPRVEMSRLQFQEASSGIHLKLPHVTSKYFKEVVKNDKKTSQLIALL